MKYYHRGHVETGDRFVAYEKGLGEAAPNDYSLFSILYSFTA